MQDPLAKHLMSFPVRKDGIQILLFGNKFLIEDHVFQRSKAVCRGSKTCGSASERVVFCSAFGYVFSAFHTAFRGNGEVREGEQTREFVFGVVV